jgi:two-component system C4-dicarboxylate transport response regulator DctD
MSTLATIQILLVDDDEDVRQSTAQALQLAGYEVQSFASVETARAQIRSGAPVIVVSDVKLPGVSGTDWLSQIRAIDPELPVILVTGHGHIAMAVAAMREGAYDFIEKPFTRERLAATVRHAVERRQLALQVRELRDALENWHGIQAALIGRSAEMQLVRRTVMALAETSADVLIYGETGTGKELVARCLHDGSRRKAANFVAINCGGMPEALFESEVFGHEAGSFTGAAKRRVGKIEHARGGSLLLDEIETMPMGIQVKLLRTLQERQFERLGSNELILMDCRIIAATKADLLALSKEQKFRADLYYRLGVAVIEIPPLRERREDIPQLFTHFLMLAALRHEREVPGVEAEHVHALMAHSWPGNVRELRNAADRFVLGLGGVPALGGGGEQASRSLEEQVSMFERHLIQEALGACSGRASSVSDVLKIPRKTLYDKMKRHGLATDDFK